MISFFSHSFKSCIALHSYFTLLYVLDTAPRVQRSCAVTVDVHGRDGMRQKGRSATVGVHEGSRRIRRLPGPTQCI
jgi:hypothetical protein